MVMNFVKLTAIQMGQEHVVYINQEKIVSVGQITTFVPKETETEAEKPEMEEVNVTTINLAGAPAIFVKETPELVIEIMKGTK